MIAYCLDSNGIFTTCETCAMEGTYPIVTRAHYIEERETGNHDLETRGGIEPGNQPNDSE